MSCKNCSINPVITLTNTKVSLCKKCFIRYFEKKVLKTIRTFNLIDKGDHIGIAVSGGKDSTTLLYLLSKLNENRKDIKLTAILINEGIEGYRDKSMIDAERYCKEFNVPLKIYSFEKEFGQPLSVLIKRINLKPCSICGVLRRYLLNKKAKELKVTKLATGHNLDDETQSILMNQIKNSIKTSARLGPITGIKEDPRFIRRIKPLYFLTEKEVLTYAFLNKLVASYDECPNCGDALRGDVRNLLNEFEKKYPGTKHAIINSFIEILPLLKKDYEVGDIKSCNICGEPCSQNICRACNLLKENGLLQQDIKEL